MANEKYNYGYSLNEELVRQGEDSHCKILQKVSPNSAVLECGPAYGIMTKYLKENLCCEVQIIEYDKDSFEQAMQFADGGICVDIEEDSWLGNFEDSSFDYIIYADILEHLRNPQTVLEKMRRFLKPNGSVLLSVPNVAHGDIILNLLGDRFNYTPLGLLDNTHIHLFARENVWAMVKDAGYYVAEEACIRSSLFATEQGKFLSLEFSERIKQFFSAYPNKDVYQFIYRLTLNEVEPESEIGIIDCLANAKELDNAYQTEAVQREVLERRAEELNKAYQTEAVQREVLEGRVEELNKAYQTEAVQREALEGRVEELNKAYQTEAEEREVLIRQVESLNKAYQIEAEKRKEADRAIQAMKTGLSGWLLKILGK